MNASSRVIVSFGAKILFPRPFIIPALAARLIPSTNEGCVVPKSVKFDFPSGDYNDLEIKFANSPRVTRRFGQ